MRNHQHFHIGKRLLQVPFVLLASALYCFSIQAQPLQKAFYEPKVSTLEGTITPQVFPGPPNYESVVKGDKAEKEWILHLATPISLEAAENDNAAVKNIKEIQLVMGFSEDKNADPALSAKSQYKKWEPLTHKGVTVLASGTLFHSFTGHHHKTILMEVHNLQRKQ